MRRPTAVLLLCLAACTHPRPWTSHPAPRPPIPDPPIRVVRSAPDFEYLDAGHERRYEVWLFNDGVVDGTFVTVQEPGLPPRVASPQEWNWLLTLRRDQWVFQDTGGRLAYLQAVYSRERTRDVNYWDGRVRFKEEAVKTIEERQWDLHSQLAALEATHGDAQMQLYLRRQLAQATDELSRERARLTLLRMKREALFSPAGASPP